MAFSLSALRGIFCTATIILGLAECPLSGTERLQLSVSRRLKMNKTHAKIKRCLLCCPLYGGCPHLRGSVKGGSTVHVSLWSSLFAYSLIASNSILSYVTFVSILHFAFLPSLSYSLLGFIQRGGTLGFSPQLEFPPSHSPRLINGSTCVTVVYV